MNEIDLTKLSDYEADVALESIFEVGEKEYISPVEAFFGIESAFANDGILSSVGRAFRNATTFRDMTKIKNAMSDIKAMSIDKISQNPSNVQISYEYFQKLMNLAKTRVKIAPEVQKLTQELLKEYDSFVRDDKMLDVLGAALGANYVSFKSIILKGIGTLIGIAGLYITTPYFGVGASGPIAALFAGFGFGLSAYMVGFYLTSFIIAISIRLTQMINGTNFADNKAIKANIDDFRKTINSMLNKALAITKKLSGVNPQSKNVEGDLETVAERQGVFSINQFIKQTKVRQTVSYEQKVKIVQELKDLVQHEDEIKKSLDNKELKRMLNEFSAFIKGFKKCGLDFPEIETQIKNGISILKYVVLVNDVFIQAVQQVISDAKKY